MTNWFNYDIVDLPTLETVWKRLEKPLIVHFHNESVPLSNQALSFLSPIADSLKTNDKIAFMNFKINSDREHVMMTDYKVFRYPTIISYDYGKESGRLSTIDEIEQNLKSFILSKLS